MTICAVILDQEGAVAGLLQREVPVGPAKARCAVTIHIRSLIDFALATVR